MLPFFHSVVHLRHAPAHALPVVRTTEFSLTHSKLFFHGSQESELRLHAFPVIVGCKIPALCPMCPNVWAAHM